MSILNPKMVFPIPNGPLSLRLPSQVIALANSEVAKATKDKQQETWPIQLSWQISNENSLSFHNYCVTIVGFSCTHQLFSNSCLSYFLIHMVSLKFFQTPSCFTIPISSQLKVPLTITVLRLPYILKRQKIL